MKVNLSAKIMQSAYLCVIFRVKHKELPFLTVLSWFLILGKIQIGILQHIKNVQKNCKVLRVVRGEGEFFIIPMVFALESSLEKNVLRCNDTPFGPIWDQIKRE